MTMTMAGGVGGGPGTWNIYKYIYIYIYQYIFKVLLSIFCTLPTDSTEAKGHVGVEAGVNGHL